DQVVALAKKAADSTPQPSDRGTGETSVVQRPEASSTANPILAERYYATGLRNYASRRYGEAERAFREAIKYDGQDPRYYYYLGLSRYQQGWSSEAAGEFQEGAKLERINRPARDAVNAALERVQGPVRQELNRYRP